MKKQRKLNLRKLSIAKLDSYVMHKTIQGGTDPASGNTCTTDAINCQTSEKTRPQNPQICDVDPTEE
jgi:natural product precursor